MERFFLKCEAELCIYNQNKACNLATPPEMNMIGMCEVCEYVTIDEEILNTAKERIHEKRDAEHEAWERKVQEREALKGLPPHSPL